MIHVFHLMPKLPQDERDIHFVRSADEAAKIWVGTHPTLYYRLVALVDAANFEEAFELTNHIDQPWTLNEGVTGLPSYGFRSSMVGDLFVNIDGGVSDFQFCAPVGFEQLEF